MRAVVKMGLTFAMLGASLVASTLGASASSASDFVAPALVKIPRTESQAGGGAVIAWGGGDYGQTRIPTEAQSGVMAISASVSWVMALNNGRVIAWGDNQYGQTSVPEAVLAGISAISAGRQHGLALKDGRVGVCFRGDPNTRKAFCRMGFRHFFASEQGFEDVGQCGVAPACVGVGCEVRDLVHGRTYRRCRTFADHPQSGVSWS